MNHYVNWLHKVAKLVFLVGNYEQTAKLKKYLDSNDPKYPLPHQKPNLLQERRRVPSKHPTEGQAGRCP